MRRTALIGWKAALIVAGMAACVRTTAAQSDTWPAAVESLELAPLAGEWFEVATSGSWSHRRCVADTRFQWLVTDARTVEVRRSCTTPSGADSRRGRLRAREPSHPGRLAERFAPALMAWLPAAWNDHWVLAVGDGRAWLLIGDRRRERLSVLSRWVSLDEASLARAIGTARRQGFDVDRLVAVPHSLAAPGTQR
jgi:apolipoprotein D and lipocalin family protein